MKDFYTEKLSESSCKFEKLLLEILSSFCVRSLHVYYMFENAAVQNL